MPALLRTCAAACVATLLAGLTVAAQNTTPQQSRAVPVKIAGCVERLLPAGSPPDTPAMYKLINTQPGRTQVSGGDTTSRPPNRRVARTSAHWAATVGHGLRLALLGLAARTLNGS